LQETATKAMQTARLAKLLRKQQEKGSTFPLRALAGRSTRTFHPLRLEKQPSTFALLAKLLRGGAKCGTPVLGG
jgi:hypothetical protein